MEQPIEQLQRQALEDYTIARELIAKHGHLTGASLHAAHKLLENAFARWVKCEKLMKADKQFCPNDDDMSQYM